jgi:hypothetical protein
LCLYSVSVIIALSKEQEERQNEKSKGFDKNQLSVLYRLDEGNRQRQICIQRREQGSRVFNEPDHRHYIKKQLNKKSRLHHTKTNNRHPTKK